MWQEDKTVILTVAPGLYEITFGFYTAKRPLVQVIVNGEPVITTVNQVSNTLSQSGKVKSKQCMSNVGGLTGSEFLMLPARARISLNFSGKSNGADGFLGLKKL